MLIVSTRIVICAALASALGWISPAPTVQPISKAARPGETTASPAATKQSPARTTTASPFNANELVPLRAELDKQLNDLSQINEKDLTPTQKTLREVWKERVQLLDEWEKATRGRLAVENPKSSPERETADRRADLDRAQSKLELLKKTPESVLPDSFKAISEKVDDANLLEMREAIEAAKLVLNEKTIECEKLRAEPAARTASLADFRAARDKLHTQIIELPTRRVQYESAIVKAANEDARKIAREHYVNLKCESGLAAERLAMTEGYIALEGRRAATCTLANQAGFQLGFPSVGSGLTSPSAGAAPQSRNANSLLVEDTLNWLKASGLPRLRAMSSGALARVRCLTLPTSTRRPDLGQGMRWRLISHLALNYLSLVEGTGVEGTGGPDALRELIGLYDIKNDPGSRMVIDGLTGVRAEPFAPDSIEAVELELHLAARAMGLALETPAVRSVSVESSVLPVSW